MISKQAKELQAQLREFSRTQAGPVAFSPENFGDLMPFLVSSAEYENRVAQLSHYSLFHYQRRLLSPSFARKSFLVSSDPGSRFGLLTFGEFGQPKKRSLLAQAQAILYTGFNLSQISEVEKPGLGLTITQFQGQKMIDKNFASETFGRFSFREIMMKYLFYLSLWLRQQGFDELQHVGLMKQMHRNNRQTTNERQEMALANGFVVEGTASSIPDRFFQWSTKQLDQPNSYIRPLVVEPIPPGLQSFFDTTQR